MKKMFAAVPYIFLCLSGAGFLDASYLVFLHYRGVGASCFLVEGCDEVLTSQYATVFGIPVALLGVLYYAIIFLLAALYFAERRGRYIMYAAYGAFAGFLASIAFLYIQIFVLRAFCVYCLISALISILLFAMGVFVIQYKKVGNI
jgi:uncharacterized membrane protein